MDQYRGKKWNKSKKTFWGRKKNTQRQIRESNNYFTDLLMGLGLLRTCLDHFPLGMTNVWLKKHRRDPLLQELCLEVFKTVIKDLRGFSGAKLVELACQVKLLLLSRVQRVESGPHLVVGFMA